MDQCTACKCKTCPRLLICKGIIDICHDCVSSDIYNPWFDCALKEKVHGALSEERAEVVINDYVDTIANHIKACKRYDHDFPFVPDESADNDFTYISIGGKNYDPHYLHQYKKMLWMKYFRAHPEIVGFLHIIREHLDDIGVLAIKDQVQFGIEYIEKTEQEYLKDCAPLIKLMKSA